MTAAAGKDAPNNFIPGKGFVERLQGTILCELWRIEFRRRFFTRVDTMQQVLDRYLEFYNHHRPHLGYRTQGNPPGALFRQSIRRHAHA